MFVICVSSSCFIRFESACFWYCECVIKCSYLAWNECNVHISQTICNHFKMHLRKLRYVQLMIVDKMSPFLWKLKLRFWTYGLIRVWCSSTPNRVSRHETPRSRWFLGYNDLLEFRLWFWIKQTFVFENWRYGSGLLAW